MEFSTGKNKRMGGPNITPLIDVVFILLIFFMLTSTFRIDRGIDVALPTAEHAAQASEPETYTLSISREGEIFVEKMQVDLDGVAKRVRAFLDQNADGRVIVRSDGESAVQALVSVMDKLREAKATNVTIATDSVK